MIFRSIRWQLQLWHGLILVCVLMGFGVTAYQLERATRFRQIDQELDERLTDLHRSRDLNQSASNTNANERDHLTNNSDNETEESGISSYGSVLAKSLSSLSMRTPLQVLEYRKYAESLDAAVLSCLDGKQSAQDSLTNTAKKWTELADRIGIKEQAKAWRKAQGLRS